MGWFGDDSSQADAYNQVCGLTAWRGDLRHRERLTDLGLSIYQRYKAITKHRSATSLLLVLLATKPPR